MNITIEFSIFELVLTQSLILNRQFYLFVPNLPGKGISGPKQKIQHIGISLSTKFYLEQII